MPTARFWASLVAASLIVAPLWAQEESVHLDYDAGDECPNRAAFIAEVTARTTRARFVDKGSDVRTFQATIRSQGERTVGTLVSNTGQAGAERRVSGKTCSEVVSALALITALAIDPSASTRPVPSSPSETPASPSPKMDAAVPAHVAASPRTVPASAKDRNKDQAAASGWGLSVGAEGEGLYGHATEGASLVMVGGSVHVEVGPFARARRGPLFRIEGFLLQPTTAYRPISSQPSGNQPVGEATFTLVGGGLSCSPLYIRIASAFELHPWLGAQLHQLNGSGTSSRGDLVTNTNSGQVAWLAIGEGLEGRWGLGDSFWLLLNLQAVEPLVHRKFFFSYHPEPSTTITTTITSVPNIEGILGLGIGGRIL